MADRFNTGCCLNCGNPLIVVDGSQLCSTCNEMLEKNKYEARKKKKITDPKVIRRRMAFHPCQLIVKEIQ